MLWVRFGTRSAVQDLGKGVRFGLDSRVVEQPLQIVESDLAGLEVGIVAAPRTMLCDPVDILRP